MNFVSIFKQVRKNSITPQLTFTCSKSTEETLEIDFKQVNISWAKILEFQF